MLSHLCRSVPNNSQLVRLHQFFNPPTIRTWVTALTAPMIRILHMPNFSTRPPFFGSQLFPSLSWNSFGIPVTSTTMADDPGHVSPVIHLPVGHITDEEPIFSFITMHCLRPTTPNPYDLDGSYMFWTPVSRHQLRVIDCYFSMMNFVVNMEWALQMTT